MTTTPIPLVPPPTEDNASPLALDVAEIIRARIDNVFRIFPIVLLADVIAGSLLFLLLINISFSWAAVVWYVLLICVSILRAALAAQYRSPKRDRFTLDDYWRVLLFGTLISGITWGFSWAMLPAAATLLQKSLVLLWLSGMISGAATTLCVIHKLFFSFMLPIAVLIISYLLFVGPEPEYVLVIAMLTYIGFIVPIMLRVSYDLNFGIEQKLHNTLLKSELQSEAEELQRKESELIEERRMSKIFRSQKERADEELLHAAEERLLLLNATEEGIFGIDRQGKITFMNESALRILNLKEDDVIDEDSVSLLEGKNLSQESPTQAYIAINDCVREGKITQGMDSIYSDAEGQNLPVRFSCRPIRKNSEIIGAVISFSDMSKQKEMEAMLLQSQKLEAIGRITGGVSHDFNNLLTVIMGNLQFLKKRVKEDEKISTLVEKIMNAAKSGAELNNRLLSFSKEQSLAIAPESINALLANMEVFVGRVVDERVELEVNLTELDSVVETDRARLESALLNICVNAIDAMPERGKLTITADRLRCNSAFLPEIGEANFVRISVADTGVGIPLEIQKKIFDPFFTTKEFDKGSGLGLSSAYGFLKQSGGHLSVDSVEGEGATFNIFIPFSAQSKLAEPVPAVVELNTEPCEGTILVVEDNPNVREVAVSFLEHAGFDVITADTGASGLEMFHKHPEIRLVFSDIKMPGEMNGVEMARCIRDANPDAAVLLATGYTEKSLKDSISELDNIQCIAKPYDTAEVLNTIQLLLHPREKRA